ncbi:poly [ADP-ribose] polymerase-like [Bradysia coprophila]|uniref:poly [ADP-ribose] polymerase-like n=1 Tax=Bradysia coprophila TaxID=38358 RepID=UPI00187DC1AA|nr:poly [ADP-ribose] polymerase-like [Bradysia coprophila]XP_037040489.1 poly [ADP-ribose] polymerase-like [Bradysia coprophila]
MKPEKFTLKSGTNDDAPAPVRALKREFNNTSANKGKNQFLKVIKVIRGKKVHAFDSDTYGHGAEKWYKLNIELVNGKLYHANGSHDSSSVLAKPVENLMRQIYDINFTKKTVEELNVDTDKMGLDQFTLDQIIDAMMVIERIWHQINRGEATERFIELSSRYYSLIPYKRKASTICTYDQVTAEVRNLKGLFAIVQSYHLVRDEITSKLSIVDRYHRLNTEIIPLARTDYEFVLLEEYAKVTNHQANNDYELEIDEIFKVSRKGEDERFEPFKNFCHRYLLWHGSFLSNFVSILSHGLRIAPAEIPRLGKKFGKGIYFADMISKSTKFCVTGKDNRADGLMLLCEVAIGDNDECVETVHNSKPNLLYELPENKHSVKRIGKIYPHPDGHCTLQDGVIVPKGRPVVTDNNDLSLSYNEYVVYNEAQVRMRYLLKLNFKCIR